MDLEALRFSVAAASAGLVLAGAGLTPGEAHAQWPERPVRLIVPFSTGGGTDIQARLLANNLAENTGQRWVIENRTGAGGIVGAQIVTEQPPDGYTILFTTATLAVNTTLMAKRLNFDTRKDLVPATWVSSAPLVLCVHPSVPAKSVKELIALAKRQPGILNGGGNTPGSTSHLTGEMMKQLAGIKAVTITFRGGGPAMAALVTGDIDYLYATAPVAAPQIKAGRVRGLAVSTPQKSPAFPDLPALNTIIPGLESDNWYAMFFPKGTPENIVNQLGKEIKKALSEKKIADFYKREGLTPVGSDPETLRKHFESEVRKYAEVIEKGNIRVQ